MIPRIGAVLLAVVGLATAVPALTSTRVAHFALGSPDTQLGAGVPDRYVLNAFGCSGGNESPPLRWSGAPAGTLSFVVTLFDKDEHSSPSGWWHWIVYDIPGQADSLPAGAGALLSTRLPRGAIQGRTDLGTDAYHGPCPAKGDAPHRYVFTVYALKVASLDVPADSSGAMVVSSLRRRWCASDVSPPPTAPRCNTGSSGAACGPA
jgi:Raf kinase inhibitor-like YbhB/YbcL family protein